MHIIEIPVKEFKAYLPSDLSECDSRQYIALSGLLYLYQSGNISFEQWRVSAFYELLNLKPINTNKDDIYKRSAIEQYSRILESFFEGSDDERILKQYYVNNPIPEIKWFPFNLIGPGNDFENITFGEFIDMLEEYINFNQTGEVIYLLRMLAVAYVPVLFKKRKNPNSKKVIQRAEKFQKMHMGFVWGFYLYFTSFYKTLVDRKIFVQGNELDLSIVFDQSGKNDDSEIPGLGMRGVLVSMAETGIHGTFSEARQIPFWDAIIFMHRMAKQAIDAENHFKKMNK